jgi:hypothetical protein
VGSFTLRQLYSRGRISGTHWKENYVNRRADLNEIGEGKIHVGFEVLKAVVRKFYLQGYNAV